MSRAGSGALCRSSARARSTCVRLNPGLERRHPNNRTKPAPGQACTAPGSISSGGRPVQTPQPPPSPARLGTAQSGSGGTSSRAISSSARPDPTRFWGAPPPFGPRAHLAETRSRQPRAGLGRAREVPLVATQRRPSRKPSRVVARRARQQRSHLDDPSLDGPLDDPSGPQQVHDAGPKPIPSANLRGPQSSDSAHQCVHFGPTSQIGPMSETFLPDMSSELL